MNGETFPGGTSRSLEVERQVLRKCRRVTDLSGARLPEQVRATADAKREWEAKPQRKKRGQPAGGAKRKQLPQNGVGWSQWKSVDGVFRSGVPACRETTCCMCVNRQAKEVGRQETGKWSRRIRPTPTHFGPEVALRCQGSLERRPCTIDGHQRASPGWPAANHGLDVVVERSVKRPTLPAPPCLPFRHAR